MEMFNKDAHPATKEDIRWFWQDIDIDCDTETAWDYVTPQVDKLSEQYPFLITEWFENWYRFMPDIIDKGIDRTGQIDWNLFFSLAWPIPGGLAVPFYLMIKKLNVAQNRIVRIQIVDTIWKDKELRTKIINWELIPSIYINYMPYQLIRKRVIEKDKKINADKRKEAEADLRRGSANLKSLFDQVEQAQKEGKEVVFQ